MAELLGSESTNLDGKLTKNLENAPKIENVEKINVNCVLVRNDTETVEFALHFHTEFGDSKN